MAPFMTKNKVSKTGSPKPAMQSQEPIMVYVLTIELEKALDQMKVDLRSRNMVNAVDDLKDSLRNLKVDSSEGKRFAKLADDLNRLCFIADRIRLGSSKDAEIASLLRELNQYVGQPQNRNETIRKMRDLLDGVWADALEKTGFDESALDRKYDKSREKKDGGITMTASNMHVEGDLTDVQAHHSGAKAIELEIANVKARSIRGFQANAQLQTSVRCPYCSQSFITNEHGQG